MSLPSNPDLYIMIPPPLNDAYYLSGIIEEVINDRLPQVITEVARNLGLPDSHIIDHFNNMGGRE